MASEFQNKAAYAQAMQLVAERKEVEAQLAYAEVNGDMEYAKERIQEIAAIDARGNQLNDLYQRENRPQQQYVAPTPSERIERFGRDDNQPLDEQMRDALAIINNGRSVPITEREYGENYVKMKQMQGKRGVEQK